MRKSLIICVFTFALLGGCADQNQGKDNVSVFLSLFSDKTVRDSQTDRSKFSVATLAGVTYYVDALHGKDANSGTSPSLPFKTITKAAFSAKSGDVILVAAGTYNTALGEIFPISIAPGVTILGDESTKGGSWGYYTGSGSSPNFGSTSIEGGGNLIPSPFSPAVILASNSVIGGFKITNRMSDSMASGIILYYANNATVRNNSVIDGNNGATGIYVYQSGSNLIDNNIIRNNSIGIYQEGSTSINRVENNWIQNNGSGILLFDLKLDLGGGPAGSLGRNWIFCNTIRDIFIDHGSFLVPELFAQNNNWDHNPPTIDFWSSGGGIDIFNHDGATKVLTENSSLIAPSLCTSN